MFSNKSISRNFSVLFVVVLMLTLVGPAYAAPASFAEPTKTGTPAWLQFRAGGHVLGFAPNKVYLAGLDHALSVEFVEGQGKAPVGAALSVPTRASGTPALGKVTYPGAWRGVDVIYACAQGGLAESSYIVQPGARPEVIRLKYNTPAQLMDNGTMRFAFETGYMTENAPIAFQDINGQRVEVAVRFTLNEDLVSFAVGAYNPDYALTIDPNYVWHTFYGAAGSSDDAGRAITRDASGNIYVAGYSQASWNGPVSAAPLHAYTGGANDIVVVKLNSAGAYQWHTFYGSTSSDSGFAITSDESGIYVAGYSASTWNGPYLAAPLNPHTDGINPDMVVVKLNSAGVYQWHTFYGSPVNDLGNAITSDASGIYVAGESDASWNGPDTRPALNAYSASHEIVVLKLNSAGVYQWHTFYGSSGLDEGYAITSDANGIYLAGNSKASWNGPGSTPPLNGFRGDTEIVVIKLNSAGAYQWHTFYGSSFCADDGYGITSDGNGIYVAGVSTCGWAGPGATLPLNAHSDVDANHGDIVVIKLNSSGAYQWHTFYGSLGSDLANAITSDSSGIYVAGWSAHNWSGPGSIPPLNPHNSHDGDRDIVVVKLNPAGGYQWHTFHGSAVDDFGDAILSDGSGNLFLAGESEATWNGPGSIPPLNDYSGGTFDGFTYPVDILVVKLMAMDNSLPWRIYLPMIKR